MTVNDVLGAIVGLDDATSERLRGHRPKVTIAADRALAALFDVAPGDEAPGFTRALRLFTAARAAIVDGAPEVAAFYLEQLAEEDADAVFAGADPAALAAGGANSAAGLAASRALRAVLRHTELLVQRPAAATEDDLTALTEAGFTVTEIVVLSQVVTFVSYQTRVVHGLRVLKEVGE